jgi:hypothetical protein
MTIYSQASAPLADPESAAAYLQNNRIRQYDNYKRVLDLVDATSLSKVVCLGDLVASIRSSIFKADIHGARFWLSYARDADFEEAASDLRELLRDAARHDQSEIFELLYARLSAHADGEFLGECLAETTVEDCTRTMKTIASHMTRDEIQKAAGMVIKMAVNYDRLKVLAFLKRAGVNFGGEVFAETFGDELFSMFFYNRNIRFFRAIRDLGFDLTINQSRYADELVSKKNVDVLEWLIDKKFIDIDQNGKFLLLKAATDSTIDAFRMLLTKKIDPRIENDIIFEMAASFGHTEIMNHLLNGLKIEIGDELMLKFMSFALIARHVETFNTILDASKLAPRAVNE